METIIEFPDFYDLLYNDVIEDIKLYIRLTEGYEEILEYGAGTGRITIPLANEGHYIVALDLNEKMLNSLKKKVEYSSMLRNRISIVCADMTEYISPIKYKCIIIPLTSFNYLKTSEQQIKCLKNIERNLDENGIAVIELLSINTFQEIDSQQIIYIKRIPIAYGYYEYWRNSTLNILSKTIEQKRIFKLFDVNDNYLSEKEFTWKNSFITVNDFKKLLVGINITIEKIYGDCNLSGYNENSNDVFIQLRKGK